MAKLGPKAAPGTSYAVLRRPASAGNKRGKKKDNLGEQLGRLRAERDELVEHRKASDDILRIIAESADNTEPVFEAITRAGMRLIPGSRVSLILVREGELHYVSHSVIADERRSELAKLFPLPLDRQTVAGTAILDKRMIHVPDFAADGKDFPVTRKVFAKISGFRAILAVPLVRNRKVIGAINVSRETPGPFTDKQIALANTFADQAVIAIENVRLFNETKEALERQTATGEILRVIAGTPADAQPVFDAIAQSALRVFDVSHVGITVLDGDSIRSKATAGSADPRGEFVIPLNRDSTAGRCMLDRTVINIGDTEAADAPSFARDSGRVVGFRAIAAAPMLREGTAIGSVHTMRKSPGPFSDTQIELLKTFADQAVIAIENARLFNETREALEQQKATADVLGVIAGSPTKTDPVFEAIAASCVRLFGGKNVTVALAQGDKVELAAFATTEGVQAREKFEKLFPLPLDEGSVTGRAILGGKVVYVSDVEADPKLGERTKALARGMGYRNVLCAPMIREGKAIGTINVIRDASESLPYTEKQIALLRTFAAQAVIAIENVRLFNETKEALEQQTATSQILGVISGSPTDLRPVFDAILKSATQLCEAHLGLLNLYDGEYYRTVAQRGASEEFAKYVFERGTYKPEGGLAQATAECRPVHVPDVRLGSAYLARQPNAVKFVELAGARTSFAVPLVKEGKVIGAILIYRPEVRPFTEKQIALVSLFANQAVIAIENARLFNETKESLEQQTAISEVLRVISGSPTDVSPVLEAVASRAAKICDATDARIFLAEADHMRLSAGFGNVPVLHHEVPLTRGTASGRAILEGTPIHIPDIQAQPDEEYALGREIALRAGWRSVLAVPLMREQRALGAITLRRPEVRPFSDKQIALLKTFADQAAIAIQNVRLFNETREALEQQTATADILKVISSSTTDTQPVFEAIVRSAARLFEPCNVIINIKEGDELRRRARAGPRDTVDLDELNKAHPILLKLGHSASARAIRERRLIEILDTEALDASQMAKSSARLANYRSAVVVPLMKEEEAIGTLAITHEEPGYKLNSKQLALLQTFADQAVIAIENVRLFNELQTRNRALTEALEQQTATGDILKVISSSTSDVQPVFETIVRNAAQLCDGAYGMLFRFDGKLMDIGAHYNFTPEVFAMFRRDLPVPASRETPSAHAILERCAINVGDIHESSYSGAVKDRARALGWRSVLTVPMLREDTPIGALAVTRRDPGAFSDSYVALLKTFAAQAVIAVENVRLFNEINEALRLQTSTAEVLKTISRSTFDLEKVLQALLDNAARLSGAERGAMLRPDVQGNYAPTVIFNYQPDAPLIVRMREHPIRPGRDSINGRVLLEKRPIHVPDVLVDPEYGRQDLLGVGRFRTVLSVPMLRDGEAIGLITLNKGEEVDPFTDKQMELVTTFADQAVIAIENVRLFKEIEEKSAQLEVANKHKSDFLANMSHELRTPLNAIIGFSEALMERMFGELTEKQADYLRDIHESGKHLLSLINDILDLSKIEAGRMELELSSFHLPTALSNAMTLIRERAQRHGIELGLEVDQRLGEFQADERKFKQIMLNLLSNAVKFTPDGGRVDVSVKKDTDKIEIAVKDTGIGIAPEDQAAVFEEFKQVGGDQMRKAEGTGLGLALTRRFVELHGGTIRLESTPGKGSTFAFTLPLQQ